MVGLNCGMYKNKSKILYTKMACHLMTSLTDCNLDYTNDRTVFEELRYKLFRWDPADIGRALRK